MTRIGRYEILEELGRGGFATVYKARDSQLNRLVALKVLHEGWSNDPDFVRRFRQEAETVANLRHPNIVVVHDVGEIDRQLFIAMEFLPGEDLQAWLNRQLSPLTVAETLAILEPVAGALDYAHEKGVVHRDIKPSNMMINESGQSLQVALTDFGLVKAMESSVALTRAGQMLGSPEYMAPEQADPNRQDDIGPHTDLYSLGIVAYQLLAGRVPFPGNSISTLNAHVNLPVPSPQEFNEALPEGVTAVLLKMLAKDPADRYPSAAAFVDDLRKTTGPDPREEIERLYGQLQEARTGGDWVEVVSLAARIETMQPGYRDVQQWQAEARRQLARPGPVPAPEAEQAAEMPVSLESKAEAGHPATPAPAQPGESEASSGSGIKPVYILGIAGGLVVIGLIVGLVALVSSLGSDRDEGQGGTASEEPALHVGGVPPSTASLGDTWIRPADDMVMVYVPAGRFLMGNDEGENNEQPVHEISLDAFWIDRTEVTNAQYNRCVTDGECAPSLYEDNGFFNADDHPVVGVSWFEAEDYCAWVSGQLPTEAQWEYAARGEAGSAYPWGDQFDGPLLNFCDTNCTYDWKDDDYDDGFEYTAPVGTYPDGASWTGAYDMAGNVWEWVADWYDGDYYADSPSQNPTGPPSRDSRVLRGGSWLNDTENARSSDRYFDVPTNRNNNNGFRCAAPGSHQNEGQDLTATVIPLEESEKATATPEAPTTAAIVVTDEATQAAIVTASPDGDDPPPNASLGDSRTRPADDMVMVYVPAGRFVASGDGQPVREINVNAFWIDQTEVTNGQYNRCVADDTCEPSRYADDTDLNGDERPVVGVNWYDAEAYCAWSGSQLPTEAQWEYAARGEDGSRFPWGDVFDGQLLNFCDTNCPFDPKDDDFDDGHEQTAPVGSYPDGASWAGAYDMAGNVWEWVGDSDYRNLSGPGSGARVLRGGSWHDAYLDTRASSQVVPSYRYLNVGFRCAAPGP